MTHDTKHCDHCSCPFTPKRTGQRFCNDKQKNCRQNWHKENREFPAQVHRIIKNAGGSFTVTLRTPSPPAFNTGDKVRITPRPDASQE